MQMKKILASLLAVAMLTAALAGCTSREQPAEDSSSSSTAEREEREPGEDTVGAIIPDSKVNVQALYEENEDTVGYLTVPNVEISDVVLHYADDINNYYYRRGFDKQPDNQGVYYADFRNSFDDPSREGLNTGITIYGHAMTDDPERDTNYGDITTKFGPLHYLRPLLAESDDSYGEELARKTPYMFFSTSEENFAYEIIAISVVNSQYPNMLYNATPESFESYTDDAPYNPPLETAAEYVKMVEEEILPRSYYDYGVTLNDDDKFLFLSCCIYNLEDGTALPYPNDLRLIVVGRLVDSDAPLKEEAEFTINEDMFFDSNGAWKG